MGLYNDTLTGCAGYARAHGAAAPTASAPSATGGASHHIRRRLLALATGVVETVLAARFELCTHTGTNGTGCSI